MHGGSFFQVEPGVELYYEDRGRGDPIVVVPGWTASSEAFIHQFSHFSKTHRVICMDRRSVGRSTITLQGNDYTAQSADLYKLIDHLELKNPVLIGWSAGCLTLWAMVRRHGTKPFKGFVFIDMPPVPIAHGDEEWTEMSIAEAAEFYQALTTPKGYRDLITAFVQKELIQRKLTPEELNWIVGLFTTSPHWVAASYFADEMTSNYAQEAQDVDHSLPSLFFVADYWKEQARSYLRTRLPNTQAEFFGGHMMFWEFPERFNAVLEDFLRRLS